MSFTITQIKSHLIGLGHSSTLNKVRGIESMLERSASRFLLKCHPLESERTAPLTAVIHDDLNNYALPSDFGSLIDLIPQDNRQSWDNAFRNLAGQFDLQKARRNRTISIEGNEGTKIIRINWKSRQAKVLNTCNSLTANGTWGAVAGATSVVVDTITKFSGSGSIRLNLASTGDGISNITMSAVDFTSENGVADVIVAVYLGTDYANLTSITPTWGNDLTTKYWTGVAQTTQADGTAFRFGWNMIKCPWSTATQTGTVAPSTIDSFKITFTITAAMTAVRVDNILFSIGRNFDCKYYSKYLFKNFSTGVWESQPRANQDDDIALLDNDTLPLFLMECLMDMAQQMEGTDSAFDIGFAEKQLAVLYPAYKGLNPSMVKKATSQLGGRPGRGRW